ncbi:ATP-binding protein, partial [Paracoccus sphaerophysae]|uniref:ATP-binding protein n=1 Tax=Paracoccus sphaerophysae TaxID=690417 RepID=UPI002FBDE748
MPSLGVAVSGGGDSLALLHMAAAWGRQRGIALEAATVDHALRPESADEAALVARACPALDVPHRVLAWDHGGGGLGGLGGGGGGGGAGGGWGAG